MRIYPFLFRRVLSKMDPERAHHLAVLAIRAMGVLGAPVRALCKPSSDLQVEALGTSFASPFGLAAGFDKNATSIAGLGAIGFGHVEVGTLTAHAQPGNPKPRLFRLVDDRAVINRMGFNNEGSADAVARLVKARRSKHRPVIGVNIGKSRVTEVEDATADYVLSTERLAHLSDYLVVNVSSPNTPGLRGLQELDHLEPLLTQVAAAARTTPVLVKIAPDMDDEQIDAITALALRLGLSGLIATNTTISREGLTTPETRVEAIGAGGLSGAPLAERSLAVLRRVREIAPDKSFCVISVGGVENASDVIARIQAGATLVQGYTAFLYEGPFWVRNINSELRARLREFR